jgi:hypothetical protein
MTRTGTCSDSAECTPRDSWLRSCCPSAKSFLHQTRNHSMVTSLTMYPLERSFAAPIVTMLTFRTQASTGTREDLLAHHSEPRVVRRSSQVLSLCHQAVICGINSIYMKRVATEKGAVIMTYLRKLLPQVCKYLYNAKNIISFT